MTESQFIKENKEDWEAMETLLEKGDKDPDKLQALFVKISGDLSYARTFYPRRAVRLYLNDLLNKVFDSLRIKKKKNLWSKVLEFYGHTLPAEIIYNRKAFITSFVVFALAVAIGVFSSFESDDFVHLILGDDYVRMTEHNIDNNDPMAVYKSSDKSSMFLGITLNNIQVAFYAFVLGIVASVGTLFVLIKNGIMLGVFQTFFYQKGLFLTSFLTIWIHGTIEISSIIISGAAGLILGNSILFPGTYSRSVSLRTGVVRALIVLLSTVPLFIVAGFLEGFVTRQTGLPSMVKISIILTSLLFVLFIYVIYPYWYWRNGHYKKPSVFIHSENTDHKKVYLNSKFTAVSEKVLVHFRTKIFVLFGQLIIPFSLVFGVINYIVLEVYVDDFIRVHDMTMFNGSNILSPMLFVVLVVFCMIFMMKMSLVLYTDNYTWTDTFRKVLEQPLPLFLFAVMFVLTLYYIPYWGIGLTLFIMPYVGFARVFNQLVTEDGFKLADLWRIVGISYKNWLYFQLKIVLLFALSWCVFLISNSTMASLLKEYFGWHDFFEYAVLQNQFISSGLFFILGSILLSFGFLLLNYQYEHVDNKNNASDLKIRFEKFGDHKWSKV